MKEPAASTLHPLHVTVRRIARSGTEEDVEVSVYCPRLQDGVLLDDCVACEHCAGVSLDPSGRESSLMCRYHGAPPAPRVPAPPPAAAAQTKVSSIMTRDVLCIEPELSVERLTELLLLHNISGAPVVNREGKPIGIVSKTDLLRDRHEHSDGNEVEPSAEGPLRVRTRRGIMLELGPGFHEERILHGTVAEIMTPLAFTIPESSSVAEAAALMCAEGVHRVPVVSEAGQVVGILSAMDIMRWTAGIVA